MTTMKIKVILAVLACKLSRFLIRLLGRGGTDLPGRVALKLCPGLLGELAKGVTTILVTGTNGKTTTSRMIEQALTDSGISFFANRSGANLLSGVTAEFAAHSTLTGRCRYDYALIEADEAAFKHIARYVKARAVVVTNVFRDQLDRYGEVTHTLENILLGLELCPDATVCLNADDSLCTSLQEKIPNKVIFYGVNVPIYQNRVEELSDAPYCVRCKHEYRYSYVTYGHLGAYECPACGFRRPAPEIFVEKILSLDDESATVVFSDGKRSDTCVIGLPGGYNIYNACATMAAARALGLDPAVTVQSLGHFTCGFGRMERFSIGKTELRMILIKNPAGCNQVLNFLSQRTEEYVYAICLNDRTQDGRDVSWIWDVDFECLCGADKPLRDVWFSGTRAEDMALRFKYAGFPEERLHVEKDYERLVRMLTDQEKPVYVMPTYTAMLDLRGTISRKFGFKAFWE